MRHSALLPPVLAILQPVYVAINIISAVVRPVAPAIVPAPIPMVGCPEVWVFQMLLLTVPELLNPTSPPTRIVPLTLPVA